ncbi:MAG TPA: hypothetical protein VFV94_12680 [Polyangiaceae bacterium]|nr:hypothetical protein [Polyangiaceae bacterium]
MIKPYALSCLLLLGCGGRPEAWDQDFSSTDPVALDNAVAVVDKTQARALVLTSKGGLELDLSTLPVGQNVTLVKASPDGKRLFVLSRGISPRRNPDDERPRLTLIDTDPTPRVVRTYEFNDPLSGLVLDEKNEWAVLYVTSRDSRPVSNPNEIVLIDLAHPERDYIPMTVQNGGGGGSPQSFLITSALTMPAAPPRRLLVVQTQNSVTLIDLSGDIDDETRRATQVTIPMPANQSGVVGTPGEVVFHDADTTRGLGAELAVRLTQDTNVLLLPLVAPTAGSARPFRVEPNLVDVGGVPSSIHFVNTDDGVRLAALVGSNAVLVDSATSNTTVVALSKSFTGITLVTDALGGSSDGTDIALLWSSSAPTIGLWTLGRAIGSALHGLETLDIGAAIQTVIDVPSPDFPTSKILVSATGDFFVLDLAVPRSSPMATNGSRFNLTFAPDGQSHRLWAYAPQGTAFSSVDLETLNPTSLTTQRPIWQVFDIAESGGGTGRTAIALHNAGGNLAATTFDALAPDDGNTRFYSGLAYGGLSHE